MTIETYFDNDSSYLSLSSQWASDLACHLLTIYNEEVMRRTEFRYSFDGHFLNTLFPGIDDFPPKFACEAPSIFDSNLPQLSKSGMNWNLQQFNLMR